MQYLASFTSLLLILFAFTPTTTAISTIKFLNHCPYPLYFWTIGPAEAKLPTTDQYYTLVPSYGGSIIHPLANTEILGSGISLKIRDRPYYAKAPAGIMQVEYSHKPSINHVWYDLSAINCNPAVGPQNAEFCPFMAGGVKIWVPGSVGSQCPPAWCGKGGCWNTYMEHGSWLGEPSFKCDAGVEILVETCTQGVGPRTFEGGKRPEESGGLSPDGTCGLKEAGEGKGYECAATKWGECCSKFGFCGSSPLYCAAGCQASFGVCSAAETTTETVAVSKRGHNHPADTPIYEV